MLERMVAERLIWVLEDKQGLSPLKFGLRRFCFTADHLLPLEHDVSAAFENGKFALAVFLDLQKAYDPTWKLRALRKLLSLGFCGHLPTFIRNLFVNRNFHVRIGKTLSPSYNQVEGIPQSSVLRVFVSLLLLMILLLLSRIRVAVLFA